MCRAAALLPLALLIGAAGCMQVIDDPLSRIIVQSAHLDDVSMSNLAAFAGGGAGEANLVVRDTAGETHVFPATLSSKEIGLVLDGSVLLTWGFEFPFDVVPGERNARELVGPYEGVHVGGNVILGGHWRDMKHVSSGVKLNVTAMSAGVGFVPVTWEEMALTLVDDPIVLAPAGPPLECAADQDCAGGELCNAIVGLCEAPEPPPLVDESPRGPRELPPPRR